MEQRGGRKTSRRTPLPKMGFGPPFVWYIFQPPEVSLLCFSCTEIQDSAHQKLFWRGPSIFLEVRCLARCPSPICFCTPISRPNLFKKTTNFTRNSAEKSLFFPAILSLKRCDLLFLRELCSQLFRVRGCSNLCYGFYTRVLCKFSRPGRRLSCEVEQRFRKPFLSSFCCFGFALRSRPPCPGAPGRKVPHEVLFECFWAPDSECPKSAF